MSFIVRLLLLLAFIGVICALLVSVLAVIWMCKKLLQKQKMTANPEPQRVGQFLERGAKEGSAK